MAYEAEKDELLKELGPVADTIMFGELRSYDGGEPRIGVYKQVGKKNPKKLRVLKLRPEDAKALGEYLIWASEQVDE